ncbi:hypothetical protein FA15DRAFT_638162 [Coprinopsis marcescibilis]|uniref:F-box domain-containing protein n=1 Tax=Coprinopsis marcescibilis TaxID=230819 RepID=A0A5C3L0G6_COPMA|nr:hypothetical protein FA15DRAFT_638162 [Coprinopsis marcescibilis]
MLDTLPLELLPEIANQLPLFAMPSTLLSLALTSRRMSDLILPLIWSHLVLKNEEVAHPVIQTILSNPDKGRLVRSIHIRSGPPRPDERDLHDEEEAPNSLTDLEVAVKKGLLPILEALEIHLECAEQCSWYFINGSASYSDFSGLGKPLWRALDTSCPRFRTLILTGVQEVEFLLSLGDRRTDPSHMLSLMNITSFTFHIWWADLETLQPKLMSYIGALSPRLRVLDIGMIDGGTVAVQDSWLDATPLLDLTIPFLESLTLRYHFFKEPEAAMDFWKRHSNLEYISIAQGDQTYSYLPPCFTEEVQTLPNFLPKLKYLVAPFQDVRKLAPILHRLTSLSILDTLDTQVPYLLRQILPSGLPNLKSLCIHQEWDQFLDLPLDHPFTEGCLWNYDNISQSIPASPDIEYQYHRRELDFVAYARAIVLGAPNIEELAWATARPVDVEQFYDTIGAELSSLSRLQRFFFRGACEGSGHLNQEDVGPKQLITFARRLAEVCPRLTVVSDVGAYSIMDDYTQVCISRDERGKVSRTRLIAGNGLQLGQENRAFPRVHHRIWRKSNEKFMYSELLGRTIRQRTRLDIWDPIEPPHWHACARGYKDMLEEWRPTTESRNRDSRFAPACIASV